MADVKWIKILTNVFDDEKILLIESLPDADSLIVIWFKLLCLAGKQNNSGVFLISSNMPYTDEMFSTIFRRPLNTIRLALRTFQNYGMIEIINDAVVIPNWSKHQNFDKIEKNNEYQKIYMRERRLKQKQIAHSEPCKPNCKPNGQPNSKPNVRALEENREDKNRKEEIREDIYKEESLEEDRTETLFLLNEFKTPEETSAEIRRIILSHQESEE